MTHTQHQDDQHGGLHFEDDPVTPDADPPQSGGTPLELSALMRLRPQALDGGML